MSTGILGQNKATIRGNRSCDLEPEQAPGVREVTLLPCIQCLQLNPCDTLNVCIPGGHEGHIGNCIHPLNVKPQPITAGA